MTLGQHLDLPAERRLGDRYWAGASHLDRPTREITTGRSAPPVDPKHPDPVVLGDGARIDSRATMPVADLPPVSVGSFRAQLKAIHRWGQQKPADLARIHQPVLVMNGESDKMVPTKNTVDLDRRLPNSQLVVYPDAGHGGVFQFHEDFVKRALEFL